MRTLLFGGIGLALGIAVALHVEATTMRRADPGSYRALASGEGFVFTDRFHADRLERQLREEKARVRQLEAELERLRADGK